MTQIYIFSHDWDVISFHGNNKPETQSIFAVDGTYKR